MNWFLTILFTVIAYSFISWFSIRAGEQETVTQAFLSPVRSMVDLLLVLGGGMVYAMALFYGTRSSTFAPSIVISLGVLVSFGFSVWLSDGIITWQRVLGVVVVMVGVWLMR